MTFMQFHGCRMITYQDTFCGLSCLNIKIQCKTQGNVSYRVNFQAKGSCILKSHLRNYFRYEFYCTVYLYIRAFFIFPINILCHFGQLLSTQSVIFIEKLDRGRVFLTRVMKYLGNFAKSLRDWKLTIILSWGTKKTPSQQT